MPEFTPQLQNLLDKLALESHSSLDQLHRFIHLFQKTNQKINLSGAKTIDAIEGEMISDSLSLIPFIELSNEQQLRWIDIGTGGGFPGIPLAILNPQIQFTLLDSIQKKCNAIREICNQLNLKNITIISDRAETIAHKKEYRNKYDFATARAVGPTPVQAEFTIPFLKQNGIYLIQKNQTEEIKPYQKVIEVLGAELESIQANIANESRRIGIIRKTKHTPSNYPRSIGTPAKTPLNNFSLKKVFPTQ